jgi:hypothetical protein
VPAPIWLFVAKTKGTVVLKAVKVLRARKQESLAILPKALHHYLEERIVVASWYPENEFYGLLAGCAALYPEVENNWEMLGAATAADHAEGMYTDIVKRDAASRAKIMWKTQHDTGDLVVTAQTANSATYELRDWTSASPNYCRVVGGYFSELHRFDGAAEPSYTHPKCRSNGASQCVFVISWR